MDQKMIAFFQLIQIGKKRRTRKSTVCGDNGVCTFTTDWKRASFQMSGCLFENIFLGGVVDRKLDVNLRDLHDSHHLITGNIQSIHVGLVFFVTGCGYCK